MAERKEGGCHCGAVRFAATPDLGQTISCNCSYCSKRGFILAFVGATQFEILSGEDALTPYRFNSEKIEHLFCRVCGVQSFARGPSPQGGTMAAINVRCLDGVEIESLAPQPFDGRAL